MILMSSYVRSVVVTSIISFLAPQLLLGGLTVLLLTVALIPGCADLGQAGLQAVATFLQTFGEGSVLEGLLVLGCVAGAVGALFDTYIFYRQHGI
jgi:hypothetical protein